VAFVAHEAGISGLEALRILRLDAATAHIRQAAQAPHS
jgi:hypothetical protein